MSRYDLNALLNKKITFQNMTTGQWLNVPISSVADVTYSSSYGSVQRKDMDRVVTISSNVLEGYNPTAINDIFKNSYHEFLMIYNYFSFCELNKKNKQKQWRF
ncbi:MAG: hypothetical protein R2728_16650 [Chitinophagales bacterium]